MKRPSHLLLVLCLVFSCLFGCGGEGAAGGSSLGRSQLSTPTLLIHWAARSRSVNGPSSALSVTVSLMDPTLTNTVGTILADRLPAPAAYSAYYPTSGNVQPGSYVLFAVFHATTGGTGNVVGTAVASVTVSATGNITSPDGKTLNLGATSNLAFISVLPNQTVQVGVPTTIQVQAQDRQGNVFVLSPGSQFLTVTSGASFVKKLPNGDLSGVSAGIVTVQANVDGIISQPQTVTVSLPQITPRLVNLASNDLLINPKTGLLYATVPSSGGPTYGNRLVEINPTTGRVTRSLFVGSEPDKIGIASDGSVLYVALDGSASMKEVATSSMSVIKSFGISQSSGSGLPVSDIKVKPGDANTIAIAVRSSYPAGIIIYRGGVSLPNTCFFNQVQNLVWPSPQFIYGYDGATGLFRAFVDSTGASTLGNLQGHMNGTRTVVKYVAGALYGSDGSVISLSTGALIGHFGTFGTDVVPDPVLNRVIFASISNNYADTNLYFNLYSASNFLPVNSFAVAGPADPSTFSPPNPTLTRWGAKGLAFRSASKIFLIDSVPGL